MALAALLVNGCGSDDQPDDTAPAGSTVSASPTSTAVPWDDASQYLDARQGEYVKRQNVLESGALSTVVKETVRFNRDVPLVDRLISIPGPDGGEGARYIYTDSQVIMWNRDVEDACETAWVDMTSMPPAPVLGADVELPIMLAVEPLHALDQMIGAPRQLETTIDLTRYEVTLPGGTGLPLSRELRDDAATMERIAALEQVAEVTLPAFNGPLEIIMDTTEAMALAGAEIPPGATTMTHWMVIPDAEVAVPSVPDDLADPSCID